VRLHTHVFMTTLLGIRKPTADEEKRGAEVVFIREGRTTTYEILACKCYESWEQWNAPTEVLGDNVNDIEQWRENQR